jgi:hypothetical protein
VFAHQGGWDEVLLVLLPLGLFAILLLLARRRVDQLDRGDDGESEVVDGDEPGDPTGT